MSKVRLMGEAMYRRLAEIGIERLPAVHRSPASGVGRSSEEINRLLKKGDPLKPRKGLLDESAQKMVELVAQAGPMSYFGLTPDGHLASHSPNTVARRMRERMQERRKSLSISNLGAISTQGRKAAIR